MSEEHLDPSTYHLSISAEPVACVGDEAGRGDIELFDGTIEHCLGGSNLRLTNGRRRL
jgi:hypothetical protein